MDDSPRVLPPRRRVGRYPFARTPGQPDGQGPLVQALRRRRDLRAGLVQGLYVVAGLGLGLAAPAISRGPTAHRDTVSPLLFGLAGGLLSFIALVFSLLFLVIQNGNSAFSPRFTLFRDAPIIWHSFGYFAAVLVYCSVAGLRLGDASDVTVVVPALAVLLVLVALGLSRSLQLRAMRSLQFNDTMEQIRRRGEAVISALYRRPMVEEESTAHVELPPVVASLRWDRPTTTLVQVDLPELVGSAKEFGAVVEIDVMIGAELRRGAVVARVRADHPVEDGWSIFGAFSTGIDRKLVQDPLLAFRLLSDIGERSLSLAINDPASSVQALGCAYDLLAMLVDKRLDFGVIADAEGTPRIRLRLPTWDDFMAAAVDELHYYSSAAPTVRARLEALLVDLLELAPPPRQPAIRSRLDALRAEATGDRPGW